MTKIEINDNFFKSGGTSLLAIHVAIQLRKRGINLRPQILFQCQTTKELASFILKEQKENLIDATIVLPDRRETEFIKHSFVS